MSAPPFELDRSVPVPLHHQLASAIESAISAGELPAGARIANELELSALLGVSRGTVRRAIDSLVRRGLLVRRRGLGTHVVEGAGMVRPLQLSSLHQDLGRAGQRPSTRVLVNDVVPAPDDVAETMQLDARRPVLHLRRLRMAHGEPLALMENFLPGELADVGRHDLERIGLYDALRRAGVHLRVAQQRIGARTGSPEECRMLGEPAEAPLLTMERVTHDDTGRPVEWGRHLYRPDRYAYAVTLVGR